MVSTDPDQEPEITVAELAAMVQRGFESAEKKSEQRYAQQQAALQEFREETGGRFDSIEKKLDITIERADLHEQYLDMAGQKLQLPTLAAFTKDTQ